MTMTGGISSVMYVNLPWIPVIFQPWQDPSTGPPIQNVSELLQRIDDQFSITEKDGEVKAPLFTVLIHNAQAQHSFYRRQLLQQVMKSATSLPRRHWRRILRRGSLKNNIVRPQYLQLCYNRHKHPPLSKNPLKTRLSIPLPIHSTRLM
jgi:hypothetical protein